MWIADRHQLEPGSVEHPLDPSRETLTVLQRARGVKGDAAGIGSRAQRTAWAEVGFVFIC